MTRYDATLFDKIWHAHRVAEMPGGESLLFVDRVVLHEISAPDCFRILEAKGLPVAHPEFAIATTDHIVSTRPGRTASSFAPALAFIEAQRAGAERYGIDFVDLTDPRHAIVHVLAAEQGFTLPGFVSVCGDSHTCTLGAFGALALGIGSTEIAHVLASQTIRLVRPKTMRIWIDGRLGPNLSAKDLIVHIIARIGARAGIGYAVEYAGPCISAMSVEERMTLCNMSVEFSARIGMVAPDDEVIAYVEGRPLAPSSADFERARAHWLGLKSDVDAVFDTEITIDASQVEPMITWGTSPEDAMSIGDRVPDPASNTASETKMRALGYMGLTPGETLVGKPVDYVFIGSCTNGQLSDLRAAARMVRGRRIAAGVHAIVSPGSTSVRAAAEKEGLDRIFLDAGFEWHHSGCSMCCALGPDSVEGPKRVLSTSNRNFENRQGPGARTHLTSPAMAAAAAIAGRIVDIRRLPEARA